MSVAIRNLACVALIACGGGQKQTAEPAPEQAPLSNSAPADASPESAWSAMKRFEAEMCACTDAACAQRVSDEMTKWGQEQAKNQKKEPPKLTDEQVKAFQKVGMKMGECMTRAMASSPPNSGGSNPCGGNP